MTGGTYATSGVGSPAIYSTADITVTGAELSATNSEAVVIEGGNSVTLNNVTAYGNNATLNGQSTIPTNVLIYQSMSGDAAAGNASFVMNGGTLVSGTATMFHVTNTTATIDLSDVDLVYENSGSHTLLNASADSWGTSGKNGGNVTMNLSNQDATGDIIVDSVSSLTLNLTDGSSYTGAINPSGTAGNVYVVLSDDSVWTLTADSYITAFTGSYSSVIAGLYHLYVNGLLAL